MQLLVFSLYGCSGGGGGEENRDKFTRMWWNRKFLKG